MYNERPKFCNFYLKFSANLVKHFYNPKRTISNVESYRVDQGCPRWQRSHGTDDCMLKPRAGLGACAAD